MKAIHKYLIILISLSTMQSNCDPSHRNGNTRMIKDDKKKYTGYVPDELTAKKIAEAIWLPIYGDDVLKQKPYKVQLIKDSIWIVEGTLKPNYSGGVAYIEIRKSDGTILKVTHGK